MKSSQIYPNMHSGLYLSKNTRIKWKIKIPFKLSVLHNMCFLFTDVRFGVPEKMMHLHRNPDPNYNLLRRAYGRVIRTADLFGPLVEFMCIRVRKITFNMQFVTIH